MMEHHSYSEKTAKRIDLEIKSIVSSCYERAMNLLKEHKEILTNLAEDLIEKETIDGKDIQQRLNPQG